MNLNGIALGGMVNQQNQLADQGLKSRALDIQAGNNKAEMAFKLQQMAGERMNATMQQAQQIVGNLQSRADLPSVQQTLGALGKDIVALAQGAGLNPQTALMRYQSLIQTTPTLQEQNAQTGNKAQSEAGGAETGKVTAQNTLAPQTAAAQALIEGTKARAGAIGTAQGNAATADLQASTAGQIEAAKNQAAPQSSEGKQVQDRQLLVKQYGEDSDPVKQFDSLAGKSSSTAPAITAMAKQFQTESQNFVQVRDAFGRIASAAQTPSAFGDLALLTGYMKLIDPSTGVREGEFANAQNAAGVPDRIRNLYNRAISGERLNEGQRQDLMKQAEALFHSHLVSQTRLENNFTKLAQERGFDPKQVVIDYVGNDFRNAISGTPTPSTGGGRVKADINGNLIGVQ